MNVRQLRQLRGAPIEALVLSIYLGALMCPPFGSTFTWAMAQGATGNRGLVWHYLRALKIQVGACGAVALVQVLAGVIVWAAFTHGGTPELVWTVLLADLAASVGLWLAMVSLGPVLVLAYGWDARPAHRRPPPRPRGNSGPTPSARSTPPVSSGSARAAPRTPATPVLVAPATTAIPLPGDTPRRDRNG